VLSGILFVLKTGIPWEDLPVEMGCGCGVTCLNYIKAWQGNGVWPRIEGVLRAHLPEAHRLDWTRVAAELPLPGTAGQGPQGRKPPTSGERPPGRANRAVWSPPSAALAEGPLEILLGSTWDA
jgi:hypothetical protein